MTSNGRNVAQADRRITRADLEAKFEELTASVNTSTDAAKGAGPGLAIGVGVVLLVVVYLLGRRRGRRKQTIVEIRRV
jgi:MYXO-CTERM domain-containing protein